MTNTFAQKRPPLHRLPLRSPAAHRHRRRAALGAVNPPFRTRRVQLSTREKFGALLEQVKEVARCLRMRRRVVPCLRKQLSAIQH